MKTLTIGEKLLVLSIVLAFVALFAMAKSNFDWKHKYELECQKHESECQITVIYTIKNRTE